jgi:hypothetical protein
MHHSFDIELAQKYGALEAVLIHHFQHWISFNRSMGKNFHEGRTWTYQTLDEIAVRFPYLTKEEIRAILERLCTGRGRKSKKDGKDFEPVLIKGNFNKSAFDRTAWYAFVNENEFSNNFYEREISQMEKGDLPNGERRPPTPIPDTKNIYLNRFNSLVDTPEECLPPPPRNGGRPSSDADVGTVEIPTPKKQKKEEKPIPEEALNIAAKLWRHVSEVNPKAKAPDPRKWAKEIDLAIRLDGRTVEDLNRVIDFAFKDDFWHKTLQSADGLRRNFDKILVKSMPKKGEAGWKQQNRELALQVKHSFRADGNRFHTEFFLSDTHLVRLDTGERVLLTSEPSYFEQEMIRIFKLRKRDE